MCGICGVYGLSNKNLTQDMIRAIKHRGPDNEGFYNGKDVSLGGCCLNIVNVENGTQPIFNETKQMCIIFDGEIYNSLELREGLIKKRHHFSTKTDTEVILHLYEEQGNKCVNSLKGMFAFCIWDGKRLFLARDRMGIKPLFYTFLPENNVFMFGSEIKALFQYLKVPRVIDEDIMVQQTVLGFILDLDRTLFKGIKQLSPGMAMTVFKDPSNGKITFSTHQYFQLPYPASIKEDINSQEIEGLKNELEYKLKESCKLHSFQDNLPKGILLSGGLDSSLFTILSTKYSTSDFQTFSIADCKKHLDLKFANMVASYIKSEHHEFIIDFEDFLKELPTFVLALENLLLSGGVFNLLGDIAPFLISKNVSKYVKVAICCAGADELFGGYWMHYWPLGYADRVFGQLERLPQNSITYDLKQRLREWFPCDEDRDLYFVNTLDLLLKGSLTNRHLWASDRGSMWHGLEMRVPYLYDDVVQLAVKIPANLKIRYGISKYILRKVASSHFKEDFLFDILLRKKQALPCAFANISKKLELFCEKLISNEYMRNHPYRPYLSTKVEVLMFDLVNIIFIENGGKIPEGFDIFEVYNTTLNFRDNSVEEWNAGILTQ
jgi:asparagine synthase (glutamine-hydrolysing)